MSAGPTPGRLHAALAGCAAVCMAAALLQGCASPALPPVAEARPAAPAHAARPPGAAADSRAGATGEVIGRNERVLLYRVAEGDSWAGIAGRFLGSDTLAWQVAETAEASAPTPGRPIAVPLKPHNPLGVWPDGVQTVPILCYHRLGPGSSKMVVSPANFEAQMTWLVQNDYRVIRLSDLEAFLAGDRPLPRRAVVLTFDDGYESVHRHAFPVLRRLQLPATVFVYTDFLGGGDALTWPQLQEMRSSGLVDIQSHSKSHRNLIERRPGETDDRYRAAVDAELRVPRELLERRLPPLEVRHLAYPFGDTNDVVLDTASRQGVTLAATVVPGGNAFYAPPLLLRRTMIFGDMSLETFRSRLQVRRSLSNP